MKQSIRKYLGAATVAAIIANAAANTPIALAATMTPTASSSRAKMTARHSNTAQFEVRGTVNSTSNTSISVHVTGTSKNAASMKNTDQTFSLVRTTRISKAGKKTTLNSITAGAKVKIFGLWNKTTGTVKKIQWIKVI